MSYYYKESTIRIKNNIVDYDGSPFAPTSHTVEIFDCKGVLKQTFNDPFEVEPGIYFVDYTIPSNGKSGKWKIVWSAYAGDRSSVGVLEFEVRSP